MIKLSSYVNRDFIKDIEADTKVGAIEEMIALISKSDKIGDIDEFERAIRERENILSTGIGLSVAVPHARGNHIEDFVVAIGRCLNSIDYDAIDGKAVSLIFMIAGPKNDQKLYLKILAKISLLARNEDVKEKIRTASSIDEIYSIISDY